MTDAQRDRLIIRAMRFAVWGLGGILAFWVLHMVVTILVASRDNERIDELQRRVEQLERSAPMEKP